jgi:putative transposase
MGSMLNALPQTQQGRVKADPKAIWMPATWVNVYTAFDRFVAVNVTKFPKATETVTTDWQSLLAIYDFPAEYWQHLRTTNVIESTFATVRYRTTRTRNCVSRPTFLELTFKLIEEGDKARRRVNGLNRSSGCWSGIAFKDGEPVQDDQPGPQKLAA